VLERVVMKGMKGKKGVEWPGARSVNLWLLL
jgi:hypothetical protein